MSKEIKMVADNILVNVPLPKTERESGIVVSEEAAHAVREDLVGHVISVGPNVKDFKEGDKILLPTHGSVPVSYKGTVYHVFKEFMLFAKVD